MDRGLEAFAASGAPLRARIALAREIARAVQALHERGRVDGALHPTRVGVLDAGRIVIASACEPSPEADPLARAGFEAPEVTRGARPSRASDAFATGALAYLALAGVPPFEAPDPLERIRRVLFVDPPPLRVHAPDLPVEIEAEIAALLDRRPRRRHGIGSLLRALETVGAVASTAPATAPTPTEAEPPLTPALSPREPRGEGGSIPTPEALPRATGPSIAIAQLRARLLSSQPTSPLRRAALVAFPIVVLALLYMPASGGSLARDVAAAIERGDHAAAKRALDDATRTRPGDPLVEKLRGDLACARGAAGECLRRYRVALAARGDLRDDASLRLNVRALLGREHGCGTRRAAANLLGEIRDAGALPALEEARRSGGLLAFLCTGDSLDRAIATTRARSSPPSTGDSNLTDLTDR